MIQLKICGRAGNQFFQYAAVLVYMKKNKMKETLKISFEELEKRKTDNSTFVDVLKDFNVEEYETIDKIKMTPVQYILDFLYRLYLKILKSTKRKLNKNMDYEDYKKIEKIWHKILNKNGLYYYMPTNSYFFKSRNKNIIFWGTFENQQYFIEYDELIKKCFTPKYEENDNNEAMYNIINNSNSVCVTIRRGDFLKDKFKKDFYICNSEYFEKSIKKMNQLIDNPQYVIFSDDIEWCKKNMQFPHNTIYESGNDNIYEKIRLMYSCKNFIISNSTFSWWAQYLSRNKDKKVIAPRQWNNFEYSETIYDKNWILM